MKRKIKKVADGVYTHTFTPTEVGAFPIGEMLDALEGITPTHETLTWSFTPSKPIGKLSYEAMQASIIRDFEKKVRDSEENTFINGTNDSINQSGAIPVYDQNCKSAVLDKNGKFVRKIE